MGHRGYAFRRTRRWHDFQIIWQQMVGAVISMSLCYFIVSPRTLRRGKHRLLLWPGVEADGSFDTKTPSKPTEKDEMGRLEKVLSYIFT